MSSPGTIAVLLAIAAWMRRSVATVQSRASISTADAATGSSRESLTIKSTPQDAARRAAASARPAESATTRRSS